MKFIRIIKHTILFAFAILFFSGCNTPNANDLHSRIKQAIDTIKIIDTHEHLMSEKSRLGLTTDIYYLFQNYARYDLISAGLNKENEKFIFNSENPLEERWNKFYPYWQKSRNTAYSQCVLIAVKDLFGSDDINESTYKELNEKVLNSNHEGWYNYVLKEKSGIELSILDPLDRYINIDPSIDPDFFIQVKRFDNYIKTSAKRIKNIEDETGQKIVTLNDYINALDLEFQNAINIDKIVGIKSGLAYGRTLFYDDVPKPEAEKIFDKILSSNKLTLEESKKLQDFMMHQVIGKAEKYNLPVQIHTGILAGNSRPNPIENTSATNLSNLFLKFPNVKFVIFHGSYPYMAELGVLAKNFPNVYIDMCWMYIISPEASRTYLEEWLLTVPSNKIMAFGGDMGTTVEGIYGHVVLARKIIAEVLTEMVEKGYYSKNEAIQIANKILRQNAIDLYNLKI